LSAGRRGGGHEPAEKNDKLMVFYRVDG